MAIISILTDFGDRDGFVGVMKGVIWKIAPGAQIADLTHWIEPQNVTHGALILGQAYHYFPAGTVHVAVVDPGVGTRRRAIAARIGEHIFVAPDNGLLTLPLEHAETNRWGVEAVELDQPRFWLPGVSKSFHGRDIFAPCAAHLANGVHLEEMGSPLTTPILRIAINKPEPVPGGLVGQVLMADVFGNLITNLSAEMLAGKEITAVRIGKERIDRLSTTFGENIPGSLIAMIDSSGWLSICVVNGNAQQQLAVKPGDRVEVDLR